MTFLDRHRDREEWLKWAIEFARRGLWASPVIQVHGPHGPHADMMWSEAEACVDGEPSGSLDLDGVLRREEFPESMMCGTCGSSPRMSGTLVAASSFHLSPRAGFPVTPSDGSGSQGRPTAGNRRLGLRSPGKSGNDVQQQFFRAATSTDMEVATNRDKSKMSAARRDGISPVEARPPAPFSRLEPFGFKDCNDQLRAITPSYAHCPAEPSAA